MNVIDAFVLSVGFDTTGITAGRRQILEEFKQVKNEASNVGKTMESEGKRAAEFFAQVKTEAMALIGVLTGSAGIGALVKHVSDDLAGLGRAAANLDMDPQLLQAWGLAMRREVGGSIEATTSQLRYLQTELTLWKNFGTSAISDAGKAIEIDPSMSPIQALMQAAKYVATTKDDNARQMQLLQGIGLDDKSIAFVRMGADRMRKAVQDSMPDTSTRRQIEQATALSNAFIALGDALKHIADNIVSDDVAPWLTPLLGKMREFTHDHPQFVATVEKIGGALSLWLGMRAAAGLIATATGMTKLATAMDWLAASALRLFAPLAALGFIGAAGGQATQAETDAYTEKLKREGGLPTGNERATTGWRGWLNQHLPSWMTGAGLTPADPAVVARSLGQGGTGGTGPRASGAGGQDFSGSHKDFVEKAWPLALEASKRTGIDPNIIMAQAALESRWGQSAPGNNYFGIKGGGPRMATQEFINGQMVTTSASFANHGSMAGSFDAYANFINNNPRYAGLKGAQGLDAQIAALQASGYATDPAYAEKIRNLIAQIQRQKAAASSGSALPPPTLEPKKAPNPLDNIDPNAPNLFPPRDSPFKSMPMPTNTPVSSSGNTDQSSTFTVGEIHVHTQATDASGIGRDIHQALANELMSKSDRGLS